MSVTNESTHLRRLATHWCQTHGVHLALRLALGLRAGEPVWNGQAGDTRRFDGQGHRPGGETGLGLARYLVGEGYLRAPSGHGGPLGLTPVLLTNKGAQALIARGHTYQSDTRRTELARLGDARAVLHWAPVSDDGRTYRPGRLSLQIHVDVAGREFHVRASTDDRLSEQLRAFISRQLEHEPAHKAAIERALESAAQLRGRYPTPLNAAITEALIPETVWRDIREINSEAALRRSRA